MQHPCYFFTKFDNSFAFFDGRMNTSAEGRVKCGTIGSARERESCDRPGLCTTTVRENFLTYDLNFAEELNVVEGAAPFSVLIAVSHAAKTDALKHKEFNNEGGDVFHIGNRGDRHCFFHHVPFEQIYR